MKKKLMSLVALSLILCLVGAMAVYAEDSVVTMEGGQMMQGGGGRGGRGGGMGGGERPEDGGIPPELPEGVEAGERPEMAEGEMPEMPEGMEGGMGGGRGGQRPDGEMPVMYDVEAIQEAIASVSDSDTQATLTELLAAYQTALESSRMEPMEPGTQPTTGAQPDDTERQAAMEALEAARTALEEALTGSGIDVSTLIQLMENMNLEMRADSILISQ